MSTDQLIRALEKMEEHAGLVAISRSAIAVIRKARTVTIDQFDEINSVDRQSLLGTYRLRQKRLGRTRGNVLGFDETITSLEKQGCQRVIILIIHADDQLITVVAELSGSFLGCYIGKDAKSISED